MPEPIVRCACGLTPVDCEWCSDSGLAEKMPTTEPDCETDCVERCQGPCGVSHLIDPKEH